MKKRKGFTLTEVLAGLVILVVLSGVLTTCFLAASRTIKRANIDRAAINAAVDEVEAGKTGTGFTYTDSTWPLSYTIDGEQRYILAGTETVAPAADNPGNVGVTQLVGG